MAEALAEATPTAPSLDFVPEAQSATPPPTPTLGAETHQLKREIARLMPALRGLVLREDPELHAFYEDYLDVLRHDAVAMRGMSNGLFRMLCYEGMRQLRAEHNGSPERAT